MIENIADDATKQSWEINYLLSMAEQALETGDIKQAMSLAMGGMKLSKNSEARNYQKKFKDIIEKIEENDGSREISFSINSLKTSQRPTKSDKNGEKKISRENLIQILHLNKNLGNKETQGKLEKNRNKEVSGPKSILSNINLSLEYNSKKSPKKVKKTIHALKTQTIGKIKKCFLEQEYFLINSLKNLQGMDFLSLKTIKVTKYKFLLLLIPVKWCQNARDHIIIEEDSIRFANNSKRTHSKFNKILHQDLMWIKQLQMDIIREITEKKRLYEVMKRFLKENFTIETFQNNQCVYFHNGLSEYKLIISPIYISSQKIGFLEKVLPYPYQRSSNIHFVELDKLSSLLAFIEKKYAAITEYSEEENTIQRQSESYNNYLDRIQKCSIPFMPVSLLLLILSLFSTRNYFMILMGFGIFLIVLYGILLVFFTITYHKTISKIKNELQNSTNMNSQLPLLDETDLELIAPYFSEQEMEQFIYEYFGKEYDFDNLSFHYNRNMPTSQKDFDIPQERINKAENKKKEAISKYIQLLED